MSTSLDTLPTEIQCTIFRLLDPIGLIAASQTCRDFRATIKPQRRHFVERILALECLEEYGGVTPIFRGRDNALQPSWDDERWEAMRWACTGCLRLLSHWNFDNHSLLRLGYRKPIPGSPVALALSSWEPSGPTVSGAVVKKRKEFERAETKKLKKQYGIATTLNWGQPRQGQSLTDRLCTFREAGMEEFLNMRLDDFEKLNTFEETVILDRIAWNVERQRCGLKRHLRRCNECRFQQGDLRSHSAILRSTEYNTANLGTKTVPIVIGRRLGFGTPLDRYFPSFGADLVPDKPNCGDAPIFNIYRHDAHDKVFTLYMIRCPRCTRWLEMRVFRYGGLWPKWWPAYRHYWGTQFKNWDGCTVNEESVNNMCCNSCYADEHGEEKLSEKLIAWYQLLADTEIRSLEDRLNMGWHYIWNSISPSRQYKRYDIPHKYRFQIRSEVLSGIPWVDYDDKNKGIEYAKADLKMLNQKHKLWMQIWPKCPQEPRTTLVHPDFVDWFDCWMYGYDQLEAHWVWLRKCRKVLEEKPGLVVDWARRNEARYTR